MDLKTLAKGIFLMTSMTTGLAGCSTSSSAKAKATTFAATRDASVTIGGAAPVVLSNATLPSEQPHFTKVVLLPGRGMNTFQISAVIPGRGAVEVLASEPLSDAAALFAQEDPYGNNSFKYGGALLAPFANRIRGQLSRDHKMLHTKVAGEAINLPANWKGKNPGAEPVAMHGLILNSPVAVTNLTQNDQEATVEGHLAAGDFNGHWPSQTDMHFQISMRNNLITVQMTAKNIGNEKLPVGFGWHPYFNFPSGQREQVKLTVPATDRALVNNYDDVLPTGKTEPVKGTPYDFTHGKALGKTFLDDCFMNVVHDGKAPLVSEIVDPAAGYGIRIRSISPQIKAFQAYAPLDKSFVAFEPQFNIGDPYGKEWGHKVDNGMVVLNPEESVTYTVELELFTPHAN